MIEKYNELNKYENNFYRKKQYNIIGIDEVGRGPLAGPMVLAGVILDQNKPIYGLDDSKKLSKKKRYELSEKIKKKAKAYYIFYVDVKTIDEIGLSKSLLYAIDKIILNLEKELKIEGLLIDYIKYESKYDTISITRGDSKSNSIAAASILAKESRDEYMRDVGKKYPEYGFESNVGYGTKKHLEALRKHGCIKGIHRESFAPIKKIIGEIGYVLDKET